MKRVQEKPAEKIASTTRLQVVLAIVVDWEMGERDLAKGFLADPRVKAIRKSIGSF